MTFEALRPAAMLRLVGMMLLLNVASVSPLSAATQGELRTVSSGSISITVSVASNVTGTGLQGSYALGESSLSLRDGCINSNIVNRSYGVSAHQRSGMLRLAWSDNAGNLKILPPGQTVEGFVSDLDKELCNAGLQVSIENEVQEQTLSDVVTILLVPM